MRLQHAMFIQDLAGRLANRIQLTTDGHRAYQEAVAERLVGVGIDYAMLVIVIRRGSDGRDTLQPRFLPRHTDGDYRWTARTKHISTSYVGPQNSTMRMHMRRFTRLTNAFSKELENHIATISLHFTYYNVVRIRQTLRITPTMAAGVTDRVWDVAEIVKLLDDRPEKPNYADAQYGPALGLNQQAVAGGR